MPKKPKFLNQHKAFSSGLSGPDTETTTISLDLLLLIAGDEAGVQAIFKSANSFSYLVNRVILETEDRLVKRLYTFRISRPKMYPCGTPYMQ